MEGCCELLKTGWKRFGAFIAESVDFCASLLNRLVSYYHIYYFY